MENIMQYISISNIYLFIIISTSILDIEHSPYYIALSSTLNHEVI